MREAAEAAEAAEIADEVRTPNTSHALLHDANAHLILERSVGHTTTMAADPSSKRSSAGR